MICQRSVWVGAVAIGLFWAAPARSEPLKFEHIPAGAKWLAHINADAARTSKVMSTVIQECMKPADLASISEASQTCPWSAVQFDKLHSITLYGTRLGLRNGVAIVHGEWDKKEFLEKLKAKVQFKTSMAGGQEVFTWKKYPNTDLAHDVALAFPSAGVMVFASGTDELNQCLT